RRKRGKEREGRRNHRYIGPSGEEPSPLQVMTLRPKPRSTRSPRREEKRREQKRREEKRRGM
ncbi:MAG: hypothetical protein ACREHG_05565, partial [Candidatus Saccharimonadales bacterium]